MYKEMELTKNIRLRRLQWVGRVVGIKEEKVPMKALKEYIEGRKPVGRPRGRWLDAVERDVEMQELEKAGRDSAIEEEKDEEGPFFTQPPAYEDGTDSVFRNVGT
jgi:hypothetical protein